MLNFARIIPGILQFKSLFPTPSQYYSQVAMTRPTTNANVSRILSFWFEGPATEYWFSPKESVDDEIKSQFGDLMRQARTTELDVWAEEPKSSLALILLLDQFPRNVWRNTPDSFSSDSKALDIAARGIVQGFDREVTSAQQLFYYLPFMHSESVVGQVAGISLLEAALKRVQAPDSKEDKDLRDGLSSAKAHAVPICRFGRFPSRNEVLGRETTEEEAEFLKSHPHGF